MESNKEKITDSESNTGKEWLEKLRKKIEFSDEKLELALKHLDNSEIRLLKVLNILESATKVEDARMEKLMSILSEAKDSKIAKDIMDVLDANENGDCISSIKREIDDAKSEVGEVQTLVTGSRKLNTLVKETQKESINLMLIYNDNIQKLDELTKLGSKRYFEQMGGRFIEEGKDFHLVFVDLNGLAEINNTYGHDAGDSILIDFAKDLSNVLGIENNTAFRIHGDEFMVISEDELEVISMKMTKLTEWLERRSYKVLVGTKAIHIEASFAFGIAKKDKDDTLTILKAKAERKMYSHKCRIKGDDKYCFIDGKED